MSLNSSLDEIRLNIGKLQPGSRVNGPGERFVIWVQGCSLQCKGCINTEFLSHKPNQLISVSELYRMILNTSEIEGVTYTGGEPFEQAEGLYYLSHLLKEQGLSIISYSGFTYSELINKNDVYTTEILSTLDILIDGRYEEDKAIPLLWRGSRNQKVHFFTERYKLYEKIIDRERMDVEVEINNRSVSFTGNFNEAIISKITDRLKEEYGIMLKTLDTDIRHR